MKKFTSVSLALLSVMLLSLSTHAQGQLPNVQLKDLTGKKVSTAAFSNDGKPYVISFWATWCKPCIQELTSVEERYADWQEESGFKIIAVSVDDAQTVSKVPSFVAGRGWDYEVYMDDNSLFRQALNIQNVPYTLIVDGTGKIVYQHSGYSPGDEDELYEKFKEVAAH